MKSIFKSIILTALTFSLFLLPLESFAGTFQDDFQDGDMEGWKVNIPVGISVLNNSIRFKGQDSLIAKVGDDSWNRYSLKLRFKTDGFANNGHFSVRVMQSNDGDAVGYYELIITQKELLASLYVNNQRLESFRVPETIQNSKWYTLEIKPSNAKISFCLNEILVAQLADVNLSGYVDICSTKGSVFYVDDVVISGINVPDTGPSGPNSFTIGHFHHANSTWGKLKSID